MMFNLYEIQTRDGYTTVEGDESTLFDWIEAYAMDVGMFGGWYLEDNIVVADCDQDKCDVCDGHHIAKVRLYRIEDGV